jgi:hypothetical protein
MRQEAQGSWAERRRTRSQARPPAHPLPSGCCGEEATAVAAPTTAVVGADAAPAQAVDASPAASSTPTPTPLDPPRKRVKTVTEAIRSSNRAAVVAKKRVVLHVDGGNTSSYSCDTSLQDDILPAIIPPPFSEQPMTVLPLPASPMAAPPVQEPSMTAPPTPPPWSVHLPSYPPRVICRFCFNDSHEVQNRKCWDCWKKSDKDKAIRARDEEKFKNPTALHFILI